MTAEAEALVEAILTTSRALIAISARSLADASEEVTLPQYRTLVVLRSRGPQSLQQLADELQVVPSTATRMCDRLVRKELIRRDSAPESRREVELYVTARGTALVDEVTARRRRDIARIVAKMPREHRTELTAALHQFSLAAGELPDDERFLGWA